ncbi:hypothetical protein [Psychroserpens sp. MEBiC05023]
MLVFDKILNKRLFKRDVVALVIVIALPFSFYLYKLVPVDAEIWSNSFLNLNSDVIKDIDYHIWLFFVKIFTVSILSIWFVTCYRRWRLVLVIPIIIELYKLSLLIYSIITSYNGILNFYESLAFSLPYILILFIISNKVGYHKNMSQLWLNEVINKNLLKLPDTNMNNYMEAKNELNKLHNDRGVISKKEYLIRLIKLRDKLTI